MLNQIEQIVFMDKKVHTLMTLLNNFIIKKLVVLRFGVVILIEKMIKM